MSKKLIPLFLLALGLLTWITPVTADVITGSVEKQPLNISAISMFLLFVIFTLFITWYAANRTRSRDDFYTAGSGIPAWQNGTAIAGDWMSASSFLGITSAIYIYGFDALLLIVCIMAGWPIMLFLISERLRNLGRFTFIDVVAYRLEERPIRIVATLGSLSCTMFYMIGQIVGAGKLIQLLFGLDYIYAVISVNVLMIIYVAFGGMLAATWIQFIKAILLVIGGTAIAWLLLTEFDFSLNSILTSAVETHPDKLEVLSPGGWMDDPLAYISLGLSGLFGVIGMPHILMRLFTVKDARAARKSAFYAISIMGYFYMLVVIIGFGSILFLQNNPSYYNEAGELIGGVNMVALHITHLLGGNLLLGFMAAVTFATILAVISGLTVSAAANISHDLFAQIIYKDKLSEKKEINISRIAVLSMGVLSIVLGILFEHTNVAFIVSLSLVIAGSVNAPILIASLYWKGLTTRGAVIGSAIGLVSSVILTILGPNVMVTGLGFSEAIFPYAYATIVSMPLAFAGLWYFSVTDKSAQSEIEKDSFNDQYLKSETGLDIAAPSVH